MTDEPDAMPDGAATPTVGIIPTATSEPTEAAPDPPSPEVVAYAEAVAQPVQRMENSLAEIQTAAAEFATDPSVAQNEEWLTGIQTSSTRMLNNLQRLQEVEAPAEAAPVHDVYLQAANDCQEALNFFNEWSQSGDQALIDQAITLLGSCQDNLTEAGTMLDNLAGDGVPVETP